MPQHNSAEVRVLQKIRLSTVHIVSVSYRIMGQRETSFSSQSKVEMKSIFYELQGCDCEAVFRSVLAEKTAGVLYCVLHPVSQSLGALCTGASLRPL